MEKEVGEETRLSADGNESLAEGGMENDEDVLKFLDSMDGYITLMDSLSSTLRQGWLELASARHSMGAMRINSALFDLKDHSASTTLLTDDLGDSISSEPHFSLCKWASPGKCCSLADKFREDELSKEKHANQEDKQESNGSLHAIDNRVQKERLKLLSTFGTLVSPKLRAAQLSFETALEAIVEIANLRSAMLSAYDRVHEAVRSTIL